MRQERPSASRSLSGRRSKIYLRRLMWIAAAGLAVIAAWCATLYFIIVGFDGVPKQGAAVRADTGIVLGASLWNNEPSPGLKERLDYAFQLYKEGVFPRFIVTGGLDHNGSTLTEAEGMRNYLVEKGVPGEAVSMDTQSRSTYENLLFAKQIMDENGWASAVIVTHNYHGARAADIAETVGYDPVQVRVTDSEVLMIPYHEAREVLAFTKWLGNKLFL
ncbi:hypothetical protein SD71_17105 [Cohnella kolymensis]|uniref:DUF218 domain-containing protein n=2 Tax=Cohnella kolymensis TaxID=1590652 RepID=A0ABR5A1G4_9BACL|nr:hypothetical protein SD71_17105 [Cohnella kolymensis]